MSVIIRDYIHDWSPNPATQLNNVAQNHCMSVTIGDYVDNDWSPNLPDKVQPTRHLVGVDLDGSRSPHDATDRVALWAAAGPARASSVREKVGTGARGWHEVVDVVHHVTVSWKHEKNPSVMHILQPFPETQEI